MSNEAESEEADAVFLLRINLHDLGERIGKWTVKWLARKPGLRGEKLREWLQNVQIGDQLSPNDLSKPEIRIPGRLQNVRFRLPGDGKIKIRESKSSDEVLDRLQDALGNIAFEDNDQEFIIADLVDDLVTELFVRAAHGNLLAQSLMLRVAEKTSDSFVSLANAGAPQIKYEVRKKLHIPGIVSVNPEVTNLMHDLCNTLEQGEDYGLNLRGRAKCKRGSKSKFFTPKHRLCDMLWRHVEPLRKSAKREQKYGRWETYKDQLPSLTRRICDLPELTGDSVPEWLEVFLLIIEETTNENTLGHPAFVEGSDFFELVQPDGRGEFPLRKRLTEALRDRVAQVSKSPPD